MTTGKNPKQASMHMWAAWMMTQAPSWAEKWHKELGNNLSPESLASSGPLPDQNFLQTITEDSKQQYKEFLNGISKYQNFSYQRTVTPPPVIWHQGSTQAFDYGHDQPPNKPAVIVVPSLVNRSYIMDLSEECSLLRFLAQSGIRPILLDWGELSEDERGYSLNDYVQKRLDPVINQIVDQTNSPVTLMGYCMGGLITTALAQHSDKVKGLVLLATPWDFHVDNEWFIPYLSASSDFLEQIIETSGELPIDMMQMMFTTLNPFSIVRKFVSLGQSPTSEQAMQQFVAVEDWLNDCIPLAPKVAIECMMGWYRDNLPLKNQWKLNNKIITPSEIKVPTLSIIPKRDAIVPPASAKALHIPGAQVLEPDLGHISSVTGRHAKEKMWQPLIKYLKTLQH